MDKNFAKGRVSVVTPVYNGESFLPGFLESVRTQTYRNLELILVDDGSSDQTVTVAGYWKERLEKEGISMRIVEAPHRNASSAMGYGLPLVTGEYLCWPDSDDVLKETSIEERVAFLEEHPEYHCVRSLSWYFDPESGERTMADEKRGNLKKEDLFWDILEGRTFVCCGCYMLRSRDFFEIYPDGRIPVYPVGQNFQMLLPFMYRHKCPTLEKELYGVAVRSGSHSRQILTREQTEKKYREYELLVDEIADICQIEDQESRKRIERWKLRRQMQLAYQYKDFGKAVQVWRNLAESGEKQLFIESLRFLRGWLAETRPACVIRTIRDLGKHLQAVFRELEWRLYKMRKRRRLRGQPTIIASNCVGTIIYSDMGIPWTAPTINLMIPMPDFIKFVRNLKWYMEQKLYFLEEQDPTGYPVAGLGDIRIYFVHYKSTEEAVRKWNIRKERIDWDNLFIMGCEKDGCTYETLREFDSLPYERKVIFTKADYAEFSSAFYIEGFEECQELGTITNFKKQFLKRRYLDDFDYISFLNGKDWKKKCKRGIC